MLDKNQLSIRVERQDCCCLKMGNCRTGCSLVVAVNCSWAVAAGCNLVLDVRTLGLCYGLQIKEEPNH